MLLCLGCIFILLLSISLLRAPEGGHGRISIGFRHVLAVKETALSFRQGSGKLFGEVWILSTASEGSAGFEGLVEGGAVGQQNSGLDVTIPYPNRSSKRQSGLHACLGGGIEHWAGIRLQANGLSGGDM